MPQRSKEDELASLFKRLQELSIETQGILRRIEACTETDLIRETPATEDHSIRSIAIGHTVKFKRTGVTEGGVGIVVGITDQFLKIRRTTGRFIGFEVRRKPTSVILLDHQENKQENNS